MPIKPSSIDIYDTSAEHSLERVSYGVSFYGASIDYPLSDGTSLEFDYNLTTAKSICEVNLLKCLYLNLCKSSITSLNTQYLGKLRVLVLSWTGIQSLETDGLVNLLHLDIMCTKIKVLSTTAFSVLEQLWLITTPIDRISTTFLGNLKYLGISYTKISSL